MAAMGWDSQIPPRGPVEPCCLASTRNRPVLFRGHLPGCRRPWASAEWDRSSGLGSPRNHAKSRALSNDPWLKDTEASEPTRVSSTTFLGPRDAPGCLRRPRVHQGLWRPPRAFQALSAPRPNVRVPCPWDGSRAHAPGDVNAVWTTRTPTPSRGPATGSRLAYPLPEARPRRPGPPSRPRGFRSPLRLDDAPRSSPARPAERHEDTRVAEPWLPGSCARARIGSVGQLPCQNAPWAPAGAPSFLGPSTDARVFVLLKG